MSELSVLDVACGSRMFWFNREDPRTIFVDQRCEEHVLPDKSSSGGSRSLSISSSVQADFIALPFVDNNFAVVIFDPPHFSRNGDGGWMAKKYGKLVGDWRETIRQGFAEGFRVLRSGGTLVFKWNEDEVSVTEILGLTPERPLVGNKYGRHYKSHWIVFMKA